MKKAVYLFLGAVCCFNTFTSKAQNLQPDLGINLQVNIPPTNTEHIGLTSLYVQPVNNQDFQYRSYVVGLFNKNVYTFVNTVQESQMYVTYTVNRTLKRTAKASSTQNTTTDKQGNKVTTTTYKYDGAEDITVTMELLLSNGVAIKRYTGTASCDVNGTSTSNYQSALNEYNNNMSKKIMEQAQSQLSAKYNQMANEYLIGFRTVGLFAIGVKSRKQDYSDINEAAEGMKKWLNSSPTDMSAAEVVRATQIYDAAMTEHEPENKKARIDNEVAAVCLYEKACMEFILQHYRAAEELILKSEALDPKIHYSQEGMKDVLTLMKERKVFN